MSLAHDLANRLDEYDAAELRAGLQALALDPDTPWSVFRSIETLLDLIAGHLIAGRAPAVAPAGNGHGEAPELDGSARTTPQEPDREPFTIEVTELSDRPRTHTVTVHRTLTDEQRAQIQAIDGTPR